MDEKKFRDHKWFRDPHIWVSQNVSHLSTKDNDGSKRVVGFAHYLMCEICGEIKIKKDTL